MFYFLIKVFYVETNKQTNKKKKEINSNLKRECYLRREKFSPKGLEWCQHNPPILHRESHKMLRDSGLSPSKGRMEDSI